MREAESQHAPVEGEGRYGCYDRHAEYLGDPLAPGRDRIGDEVVRPLNAKVVKFVAEHFRRCAHQQPGEFVHPLGHLRNLRKKRVSIGAIARAGLFDLRGEGVG